MSSLAAAERCAHASVTTVRLDRHPRACTYTCMATKTISIDLEAYERLRRARRTRSESFSMVIKRASWPTPPRTAGALLKAMDGAHLVEEDVLDRLEEAQSGDRPPEDPWQGA